MKFLKKLCFGLLIILVFACVAVFVFVENRGTQFSEEILYHIFKRPVSVGYISIVFPNKIILRDINMPGAFKSKVIQLQLSMPKKVADRIIVTKLRLIEPTFIITKTKSSKVVWGHYDIAPKSYPVNNRFKQENRLPGAPGSYFLTKLKKIQGIIIKQLDIENGKVRFFNLNDSDKTSINIDSLYLRAQAVPYPMAAIDTMYKYKALIYRGNIPLSVGKLRGNGVVNFIKKNTNSVVVVQGADGEIGVTLDLKSLNNLMLVKGKIQIGNRSLRNRIKDFKKASFEEFVLSALQSTGLELGIRFRFETKMDDFKITAMSLDGNVSFKGIRHKAKEIIEKELKPFNAEIKSLNK